jgi:hypothetical protein
MPPNIATHIENSRIDRWRQPNDLVNQHMTARLQLYIVVGAMLITDLLPRPMLVLPVISSPGKWNPDVCIPNAL